MLKRFTIIVVPEGRATARKYKIHGMILAPVLAILVAVLYGAGVLLYQREMIRRQTRQVTGVVEENALLKRQHTLLSEEAARLATRVDAVEARARKFRSMLGFDGLLAQEGVGGPQVGTDAGDDFTGRIHLEDLAGLTEEAQDVDASLRQVEETFRSRSELLASVPSIPPLQGGISSGFGYRFDPFTGVRSYHPALDISNDRGTEVIATADGAVTEAGYEAGYGLAITLEHGFGFTTRYAHLLGLRVKVGQRVRKGEIIGLVGSTGRSTGYHLHYEVRVKGEPVDPLPYMVEPTQQANFAARLEKSLLAGALHPRASVGITQHGEN